MSKIKKVVPQQQCYVMHKGKYFIFSKNAFRIALYNPEVLPNFWQIQEKQSSQEIDDAIRLFDNIYFASEEYDGRTIKRIEKKILDLLWK